MSTIKVDTLQTTGGAGLYPAKAWVTYSMSGTASITADAGVSSLTDLGTGTPQFNLDNSLPAANGTCWNTACGLFWWAGTFRSKWRSHYSNKPLESLL